MFKRVAVWGGLAGALILIALVLIPVIGCGCSSTGGDRVREHTRLKKIGIATDLYTIDWDDRYPNAATNPAVQDRIKPYLDNTGFAPQITNQFEAHIHFNFALAGVAKDLRLADSSAHANESEIPVWYSVSRHRGRNFFGQPQPWHNELIVLWADSSIKTLDIHEKRFWNGLGTPFERDDTELLSK